MEMPYLSSSWPGWPPRALETEGLGTCLRSHRFSSGVDGKGEPMVNMAVRSVPSH
jgi:hypothetical protein